ncbi:trypsin-like serine peptidase [Massilia sp. TWR1-2-2]|uniref:trypsin-like serine peptidase n=1 Tax=Massilia sp. TWR1-2-2 TaxID=2804584 RepID=UPI003CF3DB70
MNKVFNNISATAAALLMASAAHSQTATPNPTGPLAKANIGPANAAGQFWTPERLKSARPLPVPQARQGMVSAAPPSALGAAAPVRNEGSPPTVQVAPRERRLFTPDKRSAVAPADAPVRPSAAGNLGACFTSTRVFPMFNGEAAEYSADRVFPYRAVGKLFFTANGAPFTCSAAVLQRRVVVTAGHCVHSGSPNGFYENFLFVPAYRDGVAPFGAWTWSNVIVAPAWANGGGMVPNPADYAMISFRDQRLEPDAPLSRLGDVAGWFGWQTGSLYPNHTSKIGYPCNLDDCEKMQNVMSASLRATDANTVEYGSDAREGSSGGPWIQNLEQVSLGGASGIDAVPNVLVGVTSYIYNDQLEKAQGSSVPDNRWIQLWKAICASSGNCN